MRDECVTTKRHWSGVSPALQFAIDHTECIDGFVGLHAPSWKDALRWIKRTDPGGTFMRPILGQLLTWGLSFQVQKEWLKIAEPDPARRAQYIALVNEVHNNGALYCLASGVQATRRADPFEGKTIACKSALLWRDADPSHRRTAPDSFAKYLSNPAVFIEPGAGHFPEMTNSSRLLEAIRSVA